MRSFLLKPSDREEGPYSNSQVAQMFADLRVNRSTPCKPAAGGEWKTIDDYLPVLKYGTQLPPSTPRRSAVAAGPAAVATPPYSRVALVDLDIPFVSILKLMFKWMAAAFIVSCCFIPVALALWFFVFAVLASFFGHAFLPSPQP